MRFKKILTSILLVSTLVTMLGGCGAGNSQSATEPKKDKSKQKLTVTTWDSDTTPQFKTIVEGFKKENPDIEVEIVDTAANDYNNKLTVMLASADSDPDIIFVKDAHAQFTMKEKGQLLKLDDYIQKDNINLSIYKGAAEKLKIDESYYTLPYRQDWYALFYNKDIFDKAGVQYPKNDMTWDEYEQLARKLTSGDGNNKIYGSHNHIWSAMVTNWAVQDGNNTRIASDYSFLKPYYEQALRMQKDGIIQNYANLKTGNIHYISVFEQQQCAMLPMGTWFIGTLLKEQEAGKVKFNWGVTRIPHPAGVEAGNSVGSITPIAINAKTDVPELSWKFVKFATSEEAGKLLAEKGMIPGAQTEAIVSKFTSMPNFPKDGKDAFDIKNAVLDKPLNKNSASVDRVIDEEHDLIMIGEEDIDTGIKNMNERVKEIVNK